MAQRRMIAKSISTSNKVNKVSDRAALLYTWIIPHCDDYGRMDAEPIAVRAIVVPMRRWTPKIVQDSLNELQLYGLIDVYTSDGEKYLEISKFDDFQTFKNDRDRIKLYPDKTAINNVIPLDSNSIHTDSFKLSEVKLSEVKLSEVKNSTPQEQTVNFFRMVESDATDYSLFLEKLNRDTGVPIDVLRREIKKFTEYWQELNATGKKHRWEKQETFEVKRRLSTWFQKSNQFKRVPSNKYEIGIA